MSASLDDLFPDFDDDALPAPRRRTVHLAARINDAGLVSAACFRKPRRIEMARSSWTTDPAAVTCRRCRKTERFRAACEP